MMQIEEEKLKNNYDFVFHVRDIVGRDEVVDEEN